MYIYNNKKQVLFCGGANASQSTSFSSLQIYLHWKYKYNCSIVLFIYRNKLDAYIYINDINSEQNESSKIIEMCLKKLPNL